MGTGLKYKMNDSLKFIFSLGHVFYQDASYVSPVYGATTYKKDITFVALGVEYKFF